MIALEAAQVTYSGKLKDGTPFDSGTTSFAPNQVIKGWTEAMQLMCEGDKWGRNLIKSACLHTCLHTT